MNCHVVSCNAWEDYMFAEFCPTDALRVWPVIERLALEGVRIWYPNDENAKDVNERLQKCTTCLFFSSENAIDQHSFRSRLIYAIGNAKRGVLISLEDAEMPVGLMMQADSLSVYSLREMDFYKTLLKDTIIQDCRDKTVCATEKQLSEWRQRAEALLKKYEKSRFRKPEPKPYCDPKDITIYRKNNEAALLIRLSTGQKYEITESVTTLGREPEEGECADITFDNTRAISRFHAILTRLDGKVSLKNDKGQFGTFVDGHELKASESATLENRAVFRLTNEDFCLLLGTDAETFRTLDQNETLRRLGEKSKNGTGHMTSGKDTRLREEKETEEKKDDEIKTVPVQQEKTLPNDAEEKGVEKPDVDELISELTVRVPRKIMPMEDPEKTVRQKVLPAVIIRLRTGELFPLRHIENVIGRKAERRKADIMLDGNEELSREHAVIYQYQNRFMIRDCGSLLGTFVNGEKISQDHACDLEDQTVFFIADEPFLFLSGETAKEAQRGKKLGILRSKESGEEKYLLSGTLMLDRLHPWKDGLLAKDTVSRKHAELYWESGSFLIKDTGSANGTWLNSLELEAHGKAVELNNGDRLWIYDIEYQFIELELK